MNKPNKPVSAPDLEAIWQRLATADLDTCLEQGHKGCSKECEATNIHIMHYSNVVEES